MISFCPLYWWVLLGLFGLLYFLSKVEEQKNKVLSLKEDPKFGKMINSNLNSPHLRLTARYGIYLAIYSIMCNILIYPSNLEELKDGLCQKFKHKQFEVNLLFIGDKLSQQRIRVAAIGLQVIAYDEALDLNGFPILLYKLFLHKYRKSTF